MRGDGESPGAIVAVDTTVVPMVIHHTHYLDEYVIIFYLLCVLTFFTGGRAIQEVLPCPNTLFMLVSVVASLSSTLTVPLGRK